MSRIPPRQIAFEELVAQLEVEHFEEQAEEVLLRLEREDASIGVAFARKHPGGGAARAANVLGFYRAEVARIPVMGRQEELRFCMGLEILWRRLQRARLAAGMSEAEAGVYPGTEDPGCLHCKPGRERVCDGCAPLGLEDEQRARLRARHSEFVAVRNELLERNLHIVFRLLQRYRNVAVSPEDLIQEANVALFRAIQGFDFTRGVRFKTYAGYWVNQAFLNAIYNQSRIVRVPAYIQKAMKKIHDATTAVAGGLRDHEGVSEESGVELDMVKSAIRGNRYTLSLDKTLDFETGARMVDLVEDEHDGEPGTLEAAEDLALHDHLEHAIGRLNAREQTILRMRYGLDGSEPATLAEVGAALGISLERVRQLQKAALEKMRVGDVAELLAQYA